MSPLLGLLGKRQKKSKLGVCPQRAQRLPGRLEGIGHLSTETSETAREV